MLLGIDRIDDIKETLQDKRIGLITNPTGVNSNLESTIDILNKHVNLVAMFSPEHGVRGELQAGVKVDDYIDKATNIKVYSLYGKTKKPTPEMLADVDVVVYDIMDVGARFYTYIYTMAYTMMACKEQNKQFVVLDRPNPVNGVDVEGNILDINYRSFVGYYPIPVRYGLTVGELAQYFNNEYNINCDLTVIKMSEYNREMDFEDTNLTFVFPSPNIPRPLTAYHYLGTCIFEGTNMSEGRGTTKPFEIIGSPFLNHQGVIEQLNKLQLPGVKFRSLFFTPTFSKYQGELCKGIEIIITNKKTFKPVQTGLHLFDIIRSTHKEFSFIKPYKEGMHPFFDLLTGTNLLRENLVTIETFISNSEKQSNNFKKQKRRYHLYGE